MISANMFYVCLRVAELRNIHAAKMIVAQRWRLKVKLGRILRTHQLPLLGTWEPVGKLHAGAVLELGRVLSAAAASLPLTDGAQVSLTKIHRLLLPLHPASWSFKQVGYYLQLLRLRTYVQLRRSGWSCCTKPSSLTYAPWMRSKPMPSCSMLRYVRARINYSQMHAQLISDRTIKG
jgi:hypothetical protein